MVEVGCMDAKVLKIINVAIQAEKDAQRIYGLGLRRSSVGGAKQLFERLVREEKKHEAALRKLLEGKIAIANPPNGGDLKLAESISQTPLPEFGELLQIIKFAVKKEQGAQRRYKKMQRFFKGKAGALLKNFEKQEENHEELLKKELVKLK